jgi:hypothetical protein
MRCSSTEGLVRDNYGWKELSERQCWKEWGRNKEVMNKAKRRILEYLGHIMTPNKKLLKSILQGQLLGERGDP